MAGFHQRITPDWFRGTPCGEEKGYRLQSHACGPVDPGTGRDLCETLPVLLRKQEPRNPERREELFCSALGSCFRRNTVPIHKQRRLFAEISNHSGLRVVWIRGRPE